MIPDWFADEYLFQAMRLWSEGHMPQVLRHFGKFINRAAGSALVDAVTESDAMRAALNAPLERPETKN